MTTEEPKPERKRSLTSSTARGFVWLVGNTVGSKVVNIGGNIVLAWLLLEEHFGLIGMAFTFTVFADNLLQGQATRDLLVHRHTSFRLWSNAAFWMSMAIGLGGGVLVAGAGPVAALVYDEQELVGLMAILALSTPAYGLSVVSEARLHAELRFRTLAIISVATVVALMVGKIGLAWAGFGAYSFALPEPIVKLVRSIVIMRLAPPIVRRSPQFRRWKYLFGDSMRMIGANAFITATMLGDCLVLGLWYGPEIVGLYYFALRNSSQTIHLFTRNMANVLFPSLSRLQGDNVRQTHAFLRASRALALVGVPFCLLQAGLADPVVRLLFAERWYPSIPVLQVLSLGMALRLITDPSYSMLKAQGRFKTLWRLTLVAAVVYYAFVIVGALRGGPLGVSTALSAWLILFGPIQLYVAVRAAGFGARDVLRVYAGPVIAGVLAVGGGVALGALIPATVPFRLVVQSMVTALTAGLIYVPLIRIACPEDVLEITNLARRFIKSRRPAASSS